MKPKHQEQVALIHYIEAMPEGSHFREIAQARLLSMQRELGYIETRKSTSRVQPYFHTETRASFTTLRVAAQTFGVTLAALKNDIKSCRFIYKILPYPAD